MASRAQRHVDDCTLDPANHVGSQNVAGPI
jgi:hypothetical protein